MYLFFAKRCKVGVERLQQIIKLCTVFEIAQLANVAVHQKEEHDNTFYSEGNVGCFDIRNDFAAGNRFFNQLCHELMDTVQLAAYIVFKHGLRCQQLAVNQMNVVRVLLLHFGNTVYVGTQLGKR